LLQHLVDFERGVEITQIAGDFEQTQPYAGHLSVASEAGEAAAIGEVFIVGARDEFAGFEFSQ
jgi:hypothetical protein